jgi:hypothetical protein
MIFLGLAIIAIGSRLAQRGRAVGREGNHAEQQHKCASKHRDLLLTGVYAAHDCRTRYEE